MYRTSEPHFGVMIINNICISNISTRCACSVSPEGRLGSYRVPYRSTGKTILLFSRSLSKHIFFNIDYFSPQMILVTIIKDGVHLNRDWYSSTEKTSSKILFHQIWTFPKDILLVWAKFRISYFTPQAGQLAPRHVVLRPGFIVAAYPVSSTWQPIPKTYLKSYIKSPSSLDSVSSMAHLMEDPTVRMDSL